jgi:hypothetical protein
LVLFVGFWNDLRSFLKGAKMSSEPSVTYWIRRAQAGDPAAAQRIWERYFQRLVGLARKKLQGAIRRAADEEDVVLSAFDSFYRAAERGRFPQLNDRHDLWQLLVLVTERKAIDLIHHERRARRGGGRGIGRGGRGRCRFLGRASGIRAGWRAGADAGVRGSGRRGVPAAAGWPG